MLAAVYYNNHDVRTVEMPKPEIGEDEFLLKVMASGICGSDVAEWYRVPKAPVILGHEATGVVEQIGAKLTNLSVGDRVFVSHHVPCNECRYCRRGHHTACETLHTTNYYPGGFAQFIRVPRINAERGTYKLPPNMSFDEGTFIEPLACVIRGQRLADIGQDDTILIIGSGISGLLHVKLAELKKVPQITVADVNPYRLKMAKRFGAHSQIDAKENVAEKLRETNRGKLADKVLVCTGATKAALAALDCVDKGGTILFFAVPEPSVEIPMPINRFWRNEITVRTSYGAAPSDLNESLAMLAQKRLTVADMITHRLSLSQVSEGFRITAEAGNSLKVILKPNELL